jgi:DNA-binding MarR family transcriptional regulator
MPEQDVGAVAHALIGAIGLVRRRLQQHQPPGDLTLPQRAALSRIGRGGPTTAAALARQEQISPQSMGATLAELEARGLIARRPDPDDGRRLVLSTTAAGEKALRQRRTARTRQLAAALSAEFSDEELAQLAVAAPLLERLAERL